MHMTKGICQPQNWSNRQLNQLGEKKSWQPLNITQPMVLPLTKLFILLLEFTP